jgi:hypothetical protein
MRLKNLKPENVRTIPYFTYTPLEIFSVEILVLVMQGKSNVDNRQHKCEPMSENVISRAYQSKFTLVATVCTIKLYNVISLPDSLHVCLILIASITFRRK